MLTQLDHIALTAEEFSRQDEFLRLAGYERAFSHDNIPNPDNKRELMEHWTDEHDLALYNQDGCIPIELIGYGHTVETSPRYSMPYEVFDASQNCTRLEVVQEESTHDAEYDTILLRTADVDASREFWEELGMTTQGPNQLQFDPLTGGVTVKLKLREDGAAPTTTPLDGRGFPCLAFVTTSISSDRDRLGESGYATTEIAQISFPDKSMRIMFVLGPEGEPVELIDPR